MVQIHTHVLKCFRLDTSYGVNKIQATPTKEGPGTS